MIARALPDQKAVLEEVPSTWERLAEERKKSLGRVND